ncbi:MAG: hypothetical protein AAGH88_00310 [Planctomycetota bacterium]
MSSKYLSCSAMLSLVLLFGCSSESSHMNNNADLHSNPNVNTPSVDDQSTTLKGLPSIFDDASSGENENQFYHFVFSNVEDEKIVVISFFNRDGKNLCGVTRFVTEDKITYYPVARSIYAEVDTTTSESGLKIDIQGPEEYGPYDSISISSFAFFVSDASSATVDSGGTVMVGHFVPSRSDWPSNIDDLSWLEGDSDSTSVLYRYASGQLDLSSASADDKTSLFNSIHQMLSFSGNYDPELEKVRSYEDWVIHTQHE